MKRLWDSTVERPGDERRWDSTIERSDDDEPSCRFVINRETFVTAEDETENIADKARINNIVSAVQAKLLRAGKRAQHSIVDKTDDTYVLEFSGVGGVVRLNLIEAIFRQSPECVRDVIVVFRDGREIVLRVEMWKEESAQKGRLGFNYKQRKMEMGKTFRTPYSVDKTLVHAEDVRFVQDTVDLAYMTGHFVPRLQIDVDNETASVITVTIRGLDEIRGTWIQVLGEMFVNRLFSCTISDWHSESDARLGCGVNSHKLMARVGIRKWDAPPVHICSKVVNEKVKRDVRSIAQEEDETDMDRKGRQVRRRIA